MADRHYLIKVLSLSAVSRLLTDEPVEKWRTAGWDGMHLHTFTQHSFEVLLHDCGWLPYKWTGCGTRFNSIGFGHLRRRHPGLLSGELIAACRKKPAAP